MDRFGTGMGNSTKIKTGESYTENISKTKNVSGMGLYWRLTVGLFFCVGALMIPNVGGFSLGTFISRSIFYIHFFGLLESDDVGWIEIENFGSYCFNRTQTFICVQNIFLGAIQKLRYAWGRWGSRILLRRPDLQEKNDKIFDM